MVGLRFRIMGDNHDSNKKKSGVKKRKRERKMKKKIEKMKSCKTEGKRLVIIIAKFNI